MLTDQLSGGETDRRAWPLTVVDATDSAAGQRRVRLVSEIDGFRLAPGQPLVLRLPCSEAVLSQFRVCGFDAVEERLDLEFDLSGDRRVLQWLRAARIGDQLIAETPRTCLAA